MTVDAGTEGERLALPEGRLLQSRVLDEPRDPLAIALDRRLTGYVVFESQESLLLGDDGRGIVTLHDGVPRLAYYTGTDRGGPAALADLATPGPYRVELYELAADVLESVVDEATFQVPPGAPAERLVGDPALATSTRRAAPDAWCTASGTGTGPDEDGHRSGPPGEVQRRTAVEAFLDDAEKIEAIREQAREEAQARAEEWGFAAQER